MEKMNFSVAIVSQHKPFPGEAVFLEYLCRRKPSGSCAWLSIMRIDSGDDGGEGVCGTSEGGGQTLTRWRFSMYDDPKDAPAEGDSIESRDRSTAAARYSGMETTRIPF
jgi:hypothetical protein